MSRTGHHEDCGRPNLFWSLQSTETTIPTDTKKEKESKPLKGFFSRRTDVWVGLGIMTTVAAPILVFYKVQKP